MLIWQYSMRASEKGVTIGFVPGATPEDRSAAAAALAARINATKVI